MTHWKNTAAKVVRDKKENRKKRKALNLSVNVFSTNIIIGDTIFRLLPPFYMVMHPSHAKV